MAGRNRRKEKKKEKRSERPETAEEKKTGVQAEADTGEDSCSLLSRLLNTHHAGADAAAIAPL